MRIDRPSMLFVDLTAEEAKELQEFAERLVLRGDVPYPLPQWYQDWLTEFGYDERQSLLLISTAFPQRVLLSLVRYHVGLTTQ